MQQTSQKYGDKELILSSGGEFICTHCRYQCHDTETWNSFLVPTGYGACWR